MAFSPEQLRTRLPPLPSTHNVWWVGLSGGLDSTVLLHALVQLQLPVSLHALHINHQISPNADQWQAQCAAFCASLGVAFTAERVQVSNTGKGIEDAARNARYAVFDRCLRAGDCLLTAHHADDQAETLLLRLMRGTGPRGLAAMAASRALGLGNLHRPLLMFSRTELESYANAHQLTWVNDESNADNHYDRNFLRNQVMPLLQSRWPGFTRKWQQTADLCGANEELLEEVAIDDLMRMEERPERVGQSISFTVYANMSRARQQNLLRYWLSVKGFAVPEQQHWEQIHLQLFGARPDAQVNISWADVSLRLYRNRIYLLPNIISFAECELQLVSQLTKIPRLKASLPNLHIRYRQGGERCQPAGRSHSQTLKKLLQDYGLEPWLRESVPLAYSGDTLVAVGDLWICEGFVAAADEAGYYLKW